MHELASHRPHNDQCRDGSVKVFRLPESECPLRSMENWAAMPTVWNWPRPANPIKQSDQIVEDWAELHAARNKADADISHWADKVDQAWLDGDMTWFSGAAGREVTAQKRLLVTHFFNHQTHHRGQAHAMITAAGEKTDDTDLFLVIPKMLV